MVTNEQYLQIVQKLSSAPCPHNDLNKLKEKYATHVASTRSMERCNSLCELLRLLEKRCLINEDDINILKEIALELRREELIYDIIQSVSRTPQIIQAPPRTQMYDTICDVIGRDIGYKWKEFSRALKIREGEIDSLEIKHRDISDRIREVLNTYRRICPAQYFRTNILQALRDARRGDLSIDIANIIDNASMT